jgi:hypothetical protein
MMSDVSKAPTSIDENMLRVFQDGKWQDVGRVLVDHRFDGTMITIPAPDTNEGKETIALLAESGWFMNGEDNQYWLPLPPEDQSNG